MTFMKIWLTYCIWWQQVICENFISKVCQMPPQAVSIFKIFSGEGPRTPRSPKGGNPLLDTPPSCLRHSVRAFGTQFPLSVRTVKNRLGTPLTAVNCVTIHNNQSHYANECARGITQLALCN